MNSQPDDPAARTQPSPPPSPCLVEGGRNAPRSRNGCWTCRTKKVKCDEARPNCRRCLRLKLLCDYSPRRKESKVGWRVVRGRASADTNGENTPVPSSSSTSDWFQSLLRQDAGRCISTFRMPVMASSASSLDLTAADHEAIRYFRTTFAKLHHTKNPDYSLYSIMFKVAEVNPVVMHMVLAVGGREMMGHQRHLETELGRGAGFPLSHYSMALKLMTDLISLESAGYFNNDAIYTALYLMLLYEQKYGDERCEGLTNHLNGAALILKHQYNGNTDLFPVPGTHQPSALSARTNGLEPEHNDHLSLYAARLLLWMVRFDTSVASCGVAGQLQATLHKLMEATSTSQDGGRSYHIEPWEKFEELHRFSNPLYRTMWGKEYPQRELLDDLENREAFFLEGACVQLRFMVAQLAKLQNVETDAEIAERRDADVEHSINSVRRKFSELIDVATSLSLTTDNSHRLVANLRGVVPQYYAVVLDFLRFRAGRVEKKDQALGARQEEALRQIMNLAFQAHRHDGDRAMVRIAWPLFLVGLETDDHLHREWVLSRFSGMSKFGNNLRRANDFLVKIVELQGKLGKRVDVRGKLQSGEFELFVI